MALCYGGGNGIEPMNEYTKDEIIIRVWTIGPWIIAILGSFSFLYSYFPDPIAPLVRISLISFTVPILAFIAMSYVYRNVSYTGGLMGWWALSFALPFWTICALSTSALLLTLLYTGKSLS